MSFPLHKFALLPEGHTGEVWQPSKAILFRKLGNTELYLPFFAEIQGKVMICFKAVAMIRKYLLVCKKYPYFVQNTGVCIPTYVNVVNASIFSLNLIGLNANI
jgi:hypothetical protein